MHIARDITNEIFKLVLNGSHKRHDIVGTRRAYLIYAVHDFPGFIQNPWIFFKKKSIKMTKEKWAGNYCSFVTES